MVPTCDASPSSGPAEDGLSFLTENLAHGGVWVVFELMDQCQRLAPVCRSPRAEFDAGACSVRDDRHQREICATAAAGMSRSEQVR